MKYGEVLAQRSVLEWLPHNLDYLEIKRLIKQHTTNRPLLKSPDVKAEFEDELFDVFADQLEKINLFVKSKSGELDRRLCDCRRRIVTIQTKARQRPSGKTGTRFAKVEADVERAGQEIQYLSRFVNAQRTGFYKLLKKYKKWTNSSHLADRFLVLLESPTAFHRQNFDKRLVEYSELVTAIETAINLGPQSPRIFSTQFRVSDSHENASLPKPMIGSQQNDHVPLASGILDKKIRSNREVYWVHYDHLVELHVFFLKHMKIHTPSPTPSLCGRGAVVSSPLASKDENVNFVVFDDLAQFSDTQGTLTLDDVTQSSVRTGGQVQWSDKDPDARVIALDAASPLSGYNSIDVLLRKKSIENVVNPNRKLDLQADIRKTAEAQLVRDFYRLHPSVIPLAKVWCKRTTFVGDFPEGRMSAFLDRDINMVALDQTEGWMAESDSKQAVPFPHAVCEIQWEGSNAPDPVRDLRTSYMVEKVPGFALDVHAIAVLYKPVGMSKPYWLPTLDRDIRKTPSSSRIHSRHHSRQSSFFHETPRSRTSSVTTPSGDPYTTPATSDSAHVDTESDAIFSKKRNPGFRRSNTIETLRGQRYWNELAGDDEELDEPYTVVVQRSRSNSVSSFDGDEPLSAFMVREVKKAFSGLKRPFKKSESSMERLALVADEFGSPSLEVSSDEEAVAWRIQPNGCRDYGTYPDGSRAPVSALRRTSYIGMILTSFAIIFATGVFAIEGPDTDSDESGWRIISNIGTLIGVLASLAISICGITLFLIDRSRPSLLHSVCVWVIFSIVCVGSGGLLAMMAKIGLGT